MSIITTAKKFIIEKSLIKTGDTLIVGVSGGADSVALTYILNHFRHEWGLNLALAHFNHNLRKGSNADQLFVKNLAESLHLPFYTERWERDKGKTKTISEDQARKKRLLFFKKLSKKLKTEKIALAHNRNDLIETVLLSLFRGTGLKGLRGILPRREVNGLILIRPLLCIDRLQIEQYLKQKKIAFRTDQTNLEPIFLRNKIRLGLLPLLKKEYNPNIEETLANLADLAATDYSFLSAEAEKVFQKISEFSKDKKSICLNLRELRKNPKAVQRMLIRLSVKALKGDANRFESKHCQEIENIIDKKPLPQILHLPSSIRVSRKGAQLIFRKK